MRKKLFFVFALMVCSTHLIAQYDANYVSLSNESINGEIYSIVEMTRKDERVKVKYFADKDQSGKSVYQRYLTWSKNKSIISVCSGTYFDRNDVPVGICIDDGYIVNKSEENEMDGLVIVYKTGGIVASDLKEGNLTVQSSTGSVTLNLRNALDRPKFFNWSKENSATVFQTHLLYYKNKLRVGTNGSTTARERRFLAVARDEDNFVRYYLVNLAGSNSLYNATNKVVKYLGGFTSNILFIINLDTGAQDSYQVKDNVGRVKREKGFSGTLPLEAAKNLLVFYFE